VGGAGLALDLATPLSQAAGVGYVALVLPAMGLPWRRALLVVAAFAGVFIAVGNPGEGAARLRAALPDCAVGLAMAE
jgi:hypothetical protein